MNNGAAGPHAAVTPRVVLDALHDATLVVDTAGRIVLAGAPAALLLGRSTAELEAAAIDDVLVGVPSAGNGDQALLVRLPNGRLDPAVGSASRARDGTTVIVVRAAPSAAYGDVTGFLAEAGGVLAASLDYDRTLVTVADIAVPFLADWCAVDILEDGELRRLAVTHADPAKGELADAFRRSTPDLAGDSPVARVLATGEAVLFSEVDEGWYDTTSRGDAHRDALASVGFRSEIIVPLSARGRTLGAMCLATAESRRRYGAADLAVAEELGRRAALAVDNARLHREAADAEQRFRTLVESLDAIVWEADPVTLRTTFVNERAQGILGYAPSDWLGRDDFWQSILHPDDRERVLATCRAQLRAELPIDVEYRVLAADGHVVWLHDTSDPVRGEDDRVRRLRGLMVDVTRRREAEDELRYRTSLLETTAESSTEGVLVVSPEGNVLSHNRRFAELWGFSATLLAQASDDAALAWARDVVVDPDAFETRVRELYADGSTPSRDEVLLRDGRVLERYGAPVVGDEGTHYGWAWFFRDVTEQKRAERALSESGERFERLAGTLQASLLPPHLPMIPGMEVDARYRAAGTGMDVGGDFYDLFRLARGRWGVVMGDVCGKGAEAARITALARYTIRAAAMQARSPATVLGLLNEAVVRDDVGERFVSVVYLALRRHRNGVSVELASGGHPLPLVLRADGTVEQVGEPGGLVGLFRGIALPETSAELQRGDALVLVTDGVTEARGKGGEFGEERLREALADNAGASASEITQRIDELVQRWQGGPHGRDDIAILVLRVRP